MVSTRAMVTDVNFHGCSEVSFQAQGPTYERTLAVHTSVINWLVINASNMLTMSLLTGISERCRRTPAG